MWYNSWLWLFLAGEGYQHLLRVMQSMEADRNKQSSLAERLQERLSRAQSEISSLQNSMAQRESHYQSLHTELLGKVSQATDTEKEVIPLTSCSKKLDLLNSQKETQYIIKSKLIYFHSVRTIQLPVCKNNNKNRVLSY